MDRPEETETESAEAGGEYTCPSCAGNREYHAFVDGVRNGRRFGEKRLVKCWTCEGRGTVTVEHHARIVKGKALREDRKARLMTLNDEAKRLGISPKELSDLESGRTEQQEGKSTTPSYS